MGRHEKMRACSGEKHIYLGRPNHPTNDIHALLSEAVGFLGILFVNTYPGNPGRQTLIH